MVASLEEYLTSNENLMEILQRTVSYIKEETGATVPINNEAFFNDLKMVVTGNISTPKVMNNIKKYQKVSLQDAIRRFNDTVFDELSEISIEKVKQKLKEKNQHVKKDKPAIKDTPRQFVIHMNSCEFNDELHDILSVKLETVELYNVDYNVNSYNNSMTIDSKHIMVEEGDYTQDSLVETLNGLLRNEMIVSVDKITSKTTIRTKTGTVPIRGEGLGESMKNNTLISLDFNVENSIAGTLGFDKKKYQNNKIYTSNNKFILSDKNVVFIKITLIDEENNIILKDKILLDNKKNTIKFHSSTLPIMSFDRPHLFKKILVDIEDSKGNPYNLRGTDITLSLRFSASR